MAVPFVPCPLTAQATMQYITNGQRANNIYHFLGTGAWSATLLAALNTYLWNWENTHAAPVRCNNTELTGIYSVDLSSQNGPYSQLSGVIAGGETDGPVSNNVTLAVKMGTALRGKSYRGRTYWIGLTDAQLTADKQSVASAAAGTIVGILDLIRSGSIPNGGQLVVRSTRTAGGYRPTGVMTPVTGLVATDFFVDSMRRRLPNHNIHR